MKCSVGRELFIRAKNSKEIKIVRNQNKLLWSTETIQLLLSLEREQ